jgi:hypothetical protein
MSTGGLDTSPWQLPVLPKPGQVVVALSPAELSVGQSAHASATALSDDGNVIAGGTITWSSDDSSVATVDNDGLVRGIAAGATRIVATIGGTLGAAVVNVTAAKPAPTVASVAVVLTRTAMNSGETAEATATARDAAGNVMAGLPVAWTSSNPRVATVSGSGVVTAGSPGTASITATVSGVSGEATLSVASLDPPDVVSSSPSPGHPNEPAGFAQLSPTLTGDVVPPTQDQFVARSSNEIGWINGGGITRVTDGGANALQIDFPAGMMGGGAPGKTWTYSSTNPQNWPQHPKAIYQSFWYKLSPNFPVNLTANKILYSNIGGGNKIALELNGSADYTLVGGIPVFDQNHGTPYTTPIWPMLGLQGIVRVDATFSNANLNPTEFGSDPVNWPQIVRDQWHHIEVLYVANTANAMDGTAKLWLDGRLVIDFTNRVQWSTTGDYWMWTSWWPVYGGGGQVPADAVNPYHRLKDFYVSGK